MSSGVRHSLSKEGTFVVSRKDASMFLQRKEGAGILENTMRVSMHNLYRETGVTGIQEAYLGRRWC